MITTPARPGDSSAVSGNSWAVPLGGGLTKKFLSSGRHKLPASLKLDESIGLYYEEASKILQSNSSSLSSLKLQLIA
jgi:hypothetical protein